MAVELYAEIKDEVRKLADITWKIALAQKEPVKVANFLNAVTEYYSNILAEDEIDFLRFYFATQMERYEND